MLIGAAEAACPQLIKSSSAQMYYVPKTKRAHFAPFLEYPESRLADTAALDATVVDFCLGPDERLRGLIISANEGIDVLPELLDRGEGRELSLQNGEPDLYLVEPGGSCRREVEMHGGVRVARDDFVHEFQKFDPASTIFVGHGDLPVATSKAANRVEVPLHLWS